MRRQLLIVIMLLCVIVVPAMVITRFAPDDQKNQPKRIEMEQVIIDEDSIPDSLLHPRWKIQRTTPITYDDLKQGPTDLKRPDNIKQEVEYNDTLNKYVIGTRMGKTWLAAPIMMNLTEYQKWSEKQLMSDYFRAKNSEIYVAKGKEKFDFTDMHFDLGPAEKIFGPGGIRVKVQGTAELKLGATMKNVDNPALPISNRKTTTINFDEKINANITGSVGDKMKLNMNYNTDATFDYDAQNMKLKYEGKEDEIVKLVEAGNVSFPSNSSLIQGASSLFGVRADFQFGKLKLQTVLSQKKTASTSVSSKGGVQLKPFEISVANYEENRHFFLAKYFYSIYDNAMSRLPTIASGVTMNRIEIWVTNKSGQTSNTRNIVALADLGDGSSDDILPHNAANNLYSELSTTFVDARDVNNTNTVLEGQTIASVEMSAGKTYEKIEKARLLTSSEYTLNKALGYVSLKTNLQNDQVVAVAYEYEYGGRTYQVGEFSSDVNDVNQALYVKALKNTENTPQMPNWKLMMKNVYYLANNIQKERFRLDVKYESDSAGVFVNYIPEEEVKKDPIIKLLGADRLNTNNRAYSDGFFDFVEGYTVSNGRIFFPKVEPFGASFEETLKEKGLIDPSKYVFQELYDATKTQAKQNAEKNKYILTGLYKGSSANVISLGAYNVPQGSVLVTAGGVTLTEGADYTVDYAAGEVTILNQSIIDAGTAVNVSLESQSDYGMMRKSMFGINWEYDFSKDFQLSGTVQHLREQALTTKVTMGSEPVNNTLIGLNLKWQKESQWLTNALNKIPLLHVTQPSTIQFKAEFAKLIAKNAGDIQDDASYIDDFESSNTGVDVATPTAWSICSAPTQYLKDNGLPYSKSDDLKTGFYRARMAWYNIDPLFTLRSSSLTPSYIKNDLNMLSDHNVREVYVNELYPNRNQSSYNGATATLPILNLAFYPEERGPYNFNTNFTPSEGKLPEPKKSWGGMMRKLNVTDFEEANIEYLEFWMMDPFINYQGDQSSEISKHTGKLYINLGEISEDILLDGRKSYESGMPVNDEGKKDETIWGYVPVQNTINYSFATSSGSRAKQDVGFNGLTDSEESSWSTYQDFINAAKNIANDSVRNEYLADPANDNYRYFRGSAWDDKKSTILDRYKFINNPQGNSPDSETVTEAYDTSYKTTPDVEDINQDYTLNEYEKYYQYEVEIDNNQMEIGQNYISDKRVSSVTLRNGTKTEVTWYLFRVPINQGKAIGGISSINSIRFMRMFMAGFEKQSILRLASLRLVRGDWRVYARKTAGFSQTSSFTPSTISIEENSDKEPVNYVLPPGISRVVDPSQPQLVENDERSLRFDVNDLSSNDAVAVYKNTTYDMRNYNRIQMFIHANSLKYDTKNVKDQELSAFIRIGSDYNINYYEYEIPLKLTPHNNKYNQYSTEARRTVWPEENMLDIDFSKFTNLKKARNKAKATGVSVTDVFSQYDPDKPKNKISVKGNPSLGEVRTMMIGVRNNSTETKDIEVWFDELRLQEPENSGGWAATADLDVQLSDLGSIKASGKHTSSGFGGLEQRVNERPTDTYSTYSVTTSLELGKFFPEKAKVTAPLYYSVTREWSTPKYNPLDTDMKLDDALDGAANQHERDSIKSIAVTKKVSKNFSLSGVRFGIATKKRPMPYDPANFSFSYSHSSSHTEGKTTVYENTIKWRGAINYSWSPVYKSYEPFKKIKSKSKNYDILKRFTLNWLPQNISVNTEMTRDYYELQERDLENLNDASNIKPSYSSQFLWNRDLAIRWDITKNLKLSFQSATRAEIEEPYGNGLPINKDLYPERYEAWKDSVWQSIKHMGTPLDYNQSFTGSYQLPLNLIPIFDWLNSDASYTASYQWVRGTVLEDGTDLGNTISNNRVTNINGAMNMEKLYNHWPFLKKANERFNKSNNTRTLAKKTSKTNKTNIDKEKQKEKDKEKEEANRKRNTYVKELSLATDSAVIINHGKRTKRIVVSARDQNGKPVNIKYKKIDDNTIKVINKEDSAVNIKLSVLALPPLDNEKWYRNMQSMARFLMMVRNINVSYRTQYSMALPGFMPSIGDIFGQRNGDIMAPGLGFAFGLIDDGYIDKAKERGWLTQDPNWSSPATTNLTKDLQVKMTVEPIRNLKIDLNMAHTKTRAKSIRYNQEGNPFTQSGSFSMTTISITSAFEGIGDANNNYHSASFEKFCNSLSEYQARVQEQYMGSTYPAGTTMAGKTFDPQATPVNKYGADVMIPAFLNAYTGYSGLDIFPTIAKMLPNWSMKYSGLSKLPWIRDHFKSVNINHGYKSIYAVGSYSSYSTYKEYMGEQLGFVTTTSGAPSPSSMFNVSTVSINEAFSPLLGIDFTLPNNLTFKAEYRTTRVLSLSMTSIQINEVTSKDWVFGMSYRINDFRFTKSRALKARRTNSGRGGAGNDNDNQSNNSQSRNKITNKSRGFAHTLNVRMDASYRRQASITRDIATVSSTATAGNNAFKLSFAADYSLSRLISMTFYYDRQSNTPLLSAGSYPTVTQDFGLSLKMSLTR